MMYRKILLSIAALSLSSQALAMEFPHGCEPVGFGFQEGQLLLNPTGEQHIYLIQNRSTRHIELERYETRDVFMSPKLQSKLDPISWAAFASDVANLHFQCLSHEVDEAANIDCQEVLAVCQYPRAKFAASNMGNYWVSTNKPQGQVIQDAAAKGIYLRW